jgi:DNA-binding phage protein
MKNRNIELADVKIMEEDYDSHFAKFLAENPKRITAFKKRVIKEYNATKDLQAFLEHLKVIAIAEKKTKLISEKVKMKRPNIYRILSKKSNPSFNNLSAIAHNLGFDFILKSA